jgi:microcystin-dependent protein
MEGMIGEVRLFAGNFAPKNWAYCNGAIINIASNTALFSILGVTYGGNGTTNFALPNLVSRVAIGAGGGPGLTNYALGAAGGVDDVTLTQPQLPAHTHVVMGQYAPGGNGGAGADSSPGGGYPATADFGDAYGGSTNGWMGASPLTAVIGTSGGNQSHTNEQPYLGMNYVICMYGIFPSRN